MEPVDFVVVDAAENVSEVGLRIKRVHFGGFDDGHRAREGFAAGV